MDKRKVTIEAVSTHTLESLWNELQQNGIAVGEKPRQTAQAVPYIAGEVEQTRLFFLESLYTGLYTSEADVMMRAYVQAHGYMQALKALKCWPDSHKHDLLANLRNRVEQHFLRGE